MFIYFTTELSRILTNAFRNSEKYHSEVLKSSRWCPQKEGTHSYMCNAKPVWATDTPEDSHCREWLLSKGRATCWLVIRKHLLSVSPSHSSVHTPIISRYTWLFKESLTMSCNCWTPMPLILPPTPQPMSDDHIPIPALRSSSKSLFQSSLFSAS